MGNRDSDFQACRRQASYPSLASTLCETGHRAIGISFGEDRPCDPRQFVGQSNDSHVLMSARLELIHPAANSVLFSIQV